MIAHLAHGLAQYVIYFVVALKAHFAIHMGLLKIVTKVLPPVKSGPIDLKTRQGRIDFLKTAFTVGVTFFAIPVIAVIVSSRLGIAASKLYQLAFGLPDSENPLLSKDES